ncbi:MAG: hypothetical protein GF411_04620 [Candidatus Lokiarchaeota archaeon]|nr:hypothetical protein [Candidatus Lokiarchaeota archaeon]
MTEREITVDLWSTDAHGVEIGIKQMEEHRAKSRQFTTDMELYGEVSGDIEGYLGYRKDPWESDKNEQRLIIRYFTKSMNWKGSLEELVAEGMARTMATDVGFPTFLGIGARTDKVARLERTFRPAVINIESYVVTLVEEDGTYHGYLIEAERFSLGEDFTVYDKYHNEIAKIDGAALDLGGKYTIKIKADYDLPAFFDDLLVLFCASIRFLEDIADRLKDNSEDIKKGEMELSLDTMEVKLYGNPRRIEY